MTLSRPVRSRVADISRDLLTGDFQLKLQSGDSVRAKNVLLATGAYINISGILSDFVPSELDLTLTSQTVAFIRISDREAMVSYLFSPHYSLLFEMKCWRG